MAFQQNSKNQPQKSGELNLAKRVSKIEFVSRPLAITTPQIMKDGCQDCLRVNDGLHHAVIVSVRKGKEKYIIENVKDKDDCYGCCQCSIFDETNTNYLLERQIVEEDLTQYITVENLYKEGKGKNNCIDAKNRIKQYINKLLNPGVPQIELTKLSYIQSLVSAIQGSFLSGKIAIMLVNGELMEQVSMVADNEINDRNLKIATFLNIIIIQTYSFFLYLGYISAEVNNQDLTFESFLLIITFQIVQIILEFLFMNTMVEQYIVSILLIIIILYLIISFCKGNSQRKKYLISICMICPYFLMMVFYLQAKYFTKICLGYMYGFYVNICERSIEKTKYYVFAIFCYPVFLGLQQENVIPIQQVIPPWVLELIPGISALGLLIYTIVKLVKKIKDQEEIQEKFISNLEKTQT